MYGKGCPHSREMLSIINGEGGGFLVTPEMIFDLNNISKQVLEVLKGKQNKNLISDFNEIETLNGWSIIQTFIKHFRHQINISEEMFPYYSAFRKRKFGNLEGDIPSLLGYAFSDIYCSLLLHVNLGISLSQIKGIILRSMIQGSAEFRFTPTGLISAIIKHSNPHEKLNSSLQILKRYIPQELDAHEYGEPSCPFILSQEIDIWLETVIKYLLETLIPEIQKHYIGRCKNFEEEFFSGNYTKTITESMEQLKSSDL